MKKKLYPKGTVHPSPPNILADQLSFLPATILALAAALSPEDKEVLAYLISCTSPGNTNFSSGADSRKPSTSTGHSGKNCSKHHPPTFNCDCFWCYMSYWLRWDSSPNRQLIHEIIDAFEDYLLKQPKSTVTAHKNNKKDRKQRKLDSSQGAAGNQLKRAELDSKDKHKLAEPDNKNNGEGDQKEQVTEKGSVRRFVSFLGEKIWSIFGQ